MVTTLHEESRPRLVVGASDEHSRLIRELFSIEDALDLFSLSVAGVHFWELVRVAVFYDTAHRLGLMGSPHADPAFKTGLWGRTGWKLNSLFLRNPFLARADLLFWCGGRRPADGGYWDCRFCDPIMGVVEASTTALETPIWGHHFTPTRTSDLRYLDAVDTYIAMRQRLPGGRFVPSGTENDLLFSLEQELEHRLGVTVRLRDSVLQKVTFRRNALPVYKQLLSRINPKLVVILVSYGKEFFIEACQDLGISVAELQHGVVGPSHPGYAFPGKGKKRSFPDYFLAFGDFWKESTPFPIAQNRVVSVGYPYFDEQRQRFAHLPKREQILFLSQSRAGHELSRMAVALANVHPSPWTVVYKLHPGEYGAWRREYPWLVNSGVRVIDSHDVPLYRLLAESRAQVGCFSTAVVEGLGFGLPTFLVALPGVSLLQPIVERGLATMVFTVDDLVESLRQVQGTSSMAVEALFKPQALANAVSWIDEKVALG